MQDVIDISWWQLLAFSVVLLIPFSISHYYKLNLNKDACLSILRMSVQLALVGLYLEYLFFLNSIVVNIIWLAVMIVVGASAVLSKAKLPKRHLLPYVVASLSFGLFPVVAILCIAIIQPTPFYSAQYVIPLAGMLLGNSISGNIVALQNFFGALQDRWAEYEAAISLGASVSIATLPFVRVALQKSLAPILATMATTGLVSLPGMMTGQILGGANPLVAIKYQLLIMLAIFVMMTVSITINLNLIIRRNFTSSGKPLILPTSEQ
ncbi:ABC transporter permease [Vibrio sp. 10N.286.49.C2]|uniref:ABC transporter permease n=1 Tax=unclassified Vibrio TaxID=2614977 RepID=UPI000C85932D|nr:MULTISPECIES: ABC transporter permease [unclassified Vibrio]PMH31441.1 ABC transporter permease [Vibrio sp. 10N.286.49.C2]PMH50462.1 ABC transporter permease [Vibrio sp. 10N.286.49.B1]PMH78056.1 ABC transporter permease [Vibrio sp. 10N.286.48.B7]